MANLAPLHSCLGQRLSILQADKLAHSILAKGFPGELVPTEAEMARREGREYETASMLLERIRAERENQAKSQPAAKRKLNKSTALVGAE